MIKSGITLHFKGPVLRIKKLAQCNDLEIRDY